MEAWKERSFQKTGRIDFAFWYGRNGVLNTLLEREKAGDPDLMKFPQIEEEEMISVIGKMKNGKATGVDGISAELMKLLIKDVDVRKHMVKCFNNVLKEKVHEDWLISKTTMVPKIKRPTILDHRPIAVTVNSSKIICTILRMKIKEHLK